MDGQALFDGSARAGCKCGSAGEPVLRQAARFGVDISTVIRWVRRLRETGMVEPGKMCPM